MSDISRPEVPIHHAHASDIHEAGLFRGGLIIASATWQPSKFHSEEPVLSECVNSCPLFPKSLIMLSRPAAFQAEYEGSIPFTRSRKARPANAWPRLDVRSAGHAGKIALARLGDVTAGRAPVTRQLAWMNAGVRRGRRL